MSSPIDLKAVPLSIHKPPPEDLLAAARNGRIELDGLRLLSRFIIPASYVDQAKIHLNEELTRRSFGEHYDIVVATTLWAELDRMIDIRREWPKTWWDAFKLRWFPKWLLVRFPAEYAGIHFKENVYKAAWVNIMTPQQDRTSIYVERKPTQIERR